MPRLAGLLGTTPGAVYARLKRSPESLPPAIRVGPWRIIFVGVDEWLEQRRRAKAEERTDA